MRTRLIAPALVAVVLGAIIRSGSDSPGFGVTWTVGLSMMLAGTAALTAVLLQTMTGLRRATERRRAEPVAPGPRTPQRIDPADRVQITRLPPSADPYQRAAVHRHPDAVAADVNARHCV
jgi:hypothetical protein